MMKKVVMILVGIIVLIIGWYLLSPLFLTKTVNEEFPLVNMVASDRDQIMDAVDGLDIEVPSLEEMREMTKDELDALEMEIVEKMEQVPDSMMNEQLSIDTSPTLLSTGEFKDGDDFHKGSGMATIYELEDGAKIVRLEDFMVTNGPDLRVLLVENASPSERGDVEMGYIELGKLKGNMGDQNYEIPSGVDVADYNSVVIYCKAFHVVFSTATLN